MLLEKFRKLSETWVAKVILGLIMIPFALFGLNYYFNQSNNGSNVIAKVAGESITQSEFNQTLKGQLEKMSAGTSESDTPQLRMSILQALAARHVMDSYAKEVHLQVPNLLLVSEIAQIPIFQEKGKFSQKQYEVALNQRGLSPVTFESELRGDLRISLVRDTLTATEWVPNTSAAAFLKLTGQERTVSYVNLGPSALSLPIKITEADAQKYYQSHKEQFQVPEQVKVDYVVLSLDDLNQTLNVTPEEIERAYKDPANTKRWQTPERIRVSHILFAVPQGATTQVKQAALAQAKKATEYLRAHPKEFSQMAKKESQDPVSAKQGGDLGFFNRGMMLPQFEKVAFSLKPQQISDPVETPYGYHVLMLTDLVPESTKSIKDVTALLTQEIKKEKAQKQFADAADSFSNLVYEQSTSLKPAADKFKLKIASSGWLTAFGAKDAPQYLNNPKLLKAIFNSESIKDGRNTQAIEVAPNVLVSARVASHEATHDRPFAEIKTTLLAMLQQDAEQKALAQMGKDQVDQLNKGKSLSLKWSQEETLSRKDAASHLPMAVSGLIFSAPIEHLPYYLGAQTDSGYMIVKLTNVRDGEANSLDQIKEAASSLEKNYAEGVLESFVAGVEQKDPLRVLSKSALETQRSNQQ